MPFYEFIWLALILAASLLILTRLMGKRTVGELTAVDFITGIAVGTIAGSATITAGLGCSHCGGHLGPGARRKRTVHAAVGRVSQTDSRQTYRLVRDGKIRPLGLKDIGLSQAALRSLLRTQKISRLADVEVAILEPSAKLG